MDWYLMRAAHPVYSVPSLTGYCWQITADTFTVSRFSRAKAQTEWVWGKLHTASEGRSPGENAWTRPFAPCSNVVFSPCFIFLFKPGWPRFACLLPSFLSFPLKERMHSVTANIDLETRGQQCTFQKVSSQCRPQKKAVLSLNLYVLTLCWKEWGIYLLSCWYSIWHHVWRYDLPLQENEINLLQKEHQKENNSHRKHRKLSSGPPMTIPHSSDC